MIPKTPLLAVDAIILHAGKIVLIRRLNEPFKGQFAIPGGFVDIGETVEQAVIREAKEETSLDIEIIKMIGIYSDPRRDARGHVVSICYLAYGSGIIKAGSDAKDIKKFRIDEIPDLAFDHNLMIKEAKLNILEILYEDRMAKNNKEE